MWYLFVLPSYGISCFSCSAISAPGIISVIVSIVGSDFGRGIVTFIEISFPLFPEPMELMRKRYEEEAFK